ncbi:orotidine 5'-phosphate decarboxylase [Skermanella stibiiresistens SB22]|uniref:Orotidine 5'-phosphate decarboxylase n=1 Tax=Skermanella stibiiresistens SB22 TaxID=1385369 RepID=W9GUK7_9PROT|nr:orotidine-5'-phosphate decarboxylase [Skermanella stibiiresistens]EWY37590.1 orotidine 5'-phosphate decarboxylase [Skermanella stibiiresistens SB22]
MTFDASIGSAAQRVFVSIDTPEIEAARGLAERLAGIVGGVKLGLEFFVGQGPAGIRAVMGGMAAEVRPPLFLDLKLHDIPNTVAAAVRAMLPLQPAFLTIHTSGGPAMMRAAVEAASMTDLPRPRLLGVTVLTSLDDDDLVSVGQGVSVLDQARRLAELAQSCGLDGIICSPAEVAALRADRGPDFVLMVPGIRPTGAPVGDQKRVMTPRDAVDQGADFLVIGRPITQAADPAAAARAIVKELL